MPHSILICVVIWFDYPNVTDNHSMLWFIIWLVLIWLWSAMLVWESWVSVLVNLRTNGQRGVGSGLDHLGFKCLKFQWILCTWFWVDPEFYRYIFVRFKPIGICLNQPWMHLWTFSFEPWEYSYRIPGIVQSYWVDPKSHICTMQLTLSYYQKWSSRF